MATQSWIELVLALPIVLWAGWPFFQRAVQSVVHRSPNMWTLIGLGTSAAFLYSVVATVVTDDGGAGHESEFGVRHQQRLALAPRGMTRTARHLATVLATT